MARDTDVGGGSLSGLWRRPLAGGRSIDGWMDETTERLLHVTNDPRVAAALREANLPLKENGT